MGERDWSSRRNVIKTLGASGMVALAGCTGDGDDSGDGDTPSGGDDQTTTDGSNGTTATTTARESVELLWADWLPESHSHVKDGIVAFANRVEELTNGEVTFNLKHGGQVGDAGQMLDLVKGGTVDAAFTVPAYYNDRLRLSNVVTLPQQYSSGIVGNNAFQQIAGGVLQEVEYGPEGLYPILPYALNPYQLIMKSKKIDSLDDFSGSVIRVSGGLQSLSVEALGGDPSEVSGSEFFTALQRGTVDGGVFPIASIGSYDLQKELNYISKNANLSSGLVINFMSLERFENLASEHQDAINQARTETARSVLESRTASLESTLEDYRDLGIETYSISDSELERWGEELSSVENQWVEQLESDGLPAERVVSEWQAALEEARE